MIDAPLYDNPLSGGAMTGPTDNQLQGDALVKQMEMRMQQRDQKTPAFMAYFKDVMNTKGYPTKTMQDYQTQFPKTTPQQVPLGADMSNANFNVSPPGTLNVTPPSVPVSEQTPLPGIIDKIRPKSDDPLVQGYMDSDFYERMSTTNVVPYTYQGKEMSGSGSYASNFKKYLDSIGQGDLIQFPDQGIAQQGTGPLTTIGGPTAPPGSATPMNPLIERGVGQDIFGNNPAEIAVPSTPNPIQGIGLDGQPFQTTGQYLTGPNQDEMLGTLKNIEKGIASLSLNYGQDFNSNRSSNYGDFDNFGIGSFFPPYGGMYG